MTPDELITEFLPVADGLARRFARRWCPLLDPDDAISEARLELVRGCREVTERKSAGPYLQLRINGALNRWMRDRHRLVRVPARVHERGGVPLRHVSLDQPLPGGDGTTMLDMLPAAEDEAIEDHGIDLEGLLDQLPASEAVALRLSLLQGRSLADAARDAGITRQAMSRRALTGIKRLRAITGAR